MRIAFPPLPPWNAAHPLIVHVPLGLLLVAPVILLLGLVVPRDRCGRAYSVAAFVVMAIGTAGAWAAVASGHAGWEVAVKIGEVADLLQEHEAQSVLARNLFTGLTGLYGLIIFLPALLGRELSSKANWALQVPFLALYAGGIVVLASAGHLGARAVHEFGVQALL